MAQPKMSLEVLIQHAEGPQTGMRGFFGFMRGDWTGSDLFAALDYYGPTATNEAVQRWYKQKVDLARDLAAAADKRKADERAS